MDKRFELDTLDETRGFDMVTGRYHSFETFGAVDGPGIRTVVFLQGCPARCLYCHNPDTWDAQGGSEIDTKTIVDRAKRGISYYGKEGGVTFSGGEPLMQGQFLAQTMGALKMVGINSIIDTSGTYIDEYTEDAIKECQMLLLDVKHPDPKKFKQIAGCEQDTLLQIIDLINKHDKPVWIRHVVVPTINDTKEDILELNEFMKKVKHIDKVELIPYHTMATKKYIKLGIKNRLEGLPAMNKEELEKLKQYVVVPEGCKK